MILSSLVNYYERLLSEDSVVIPGYGYSQEKISFALLLNDAGALLDLVDLRDTSGKKSVARSLTVPQPEKRTAGIKPNFLWDKSSYVLGVSAKEGERTAQEHAAFKSLHQSLLADSDDPGLKAVWQFLANWTPEQLTRLPAQQQQELLDANLVFRLDGAGQFVHESSAARQLRAQMLTGGDVHSGICLVTGRQAALARLHPSIKGVNGAQSAGASIVSFNLDAFSSYGKEQGDNAPVSEYATFAYTTALNHLLRRDAANRQRLQVGDTTLVFWAQAASALASHASESFIAAFLDTPSDNDAQAAAKLHSALLQVQAGQPLAELQPGLDDATPFFVLGLAPNAARLSIRYWFPSTLGQFAQRLAQHYQDLQLLPAPRQSMPSLRLLALTTTPYRNGKHQADELSPLLIGELARAVLSGGRYPQSLLATLLMRFRADGHLSDLRVALIKAVLVRQRRLNALSNQQEIPVSLDPENRDTGYLLGRLFSVLENVQRAALGPSINATIRDRYYGAASATPANVFPLLLRNTQHHLGRVRKDKPGLAISLENDIGGIVDLLPPSFAKHLVLEAQGHFAIGYYHQTQQRFAGKISARELDANDNNTEAGD